MLHALVLKLRAEQTAELPRTHGHQAHALFLRLVQAADPALAQQLHDPQTRKPSTVSGLHVPTLQRADAVRVGPGAAVWLRVTLLDDALFGPFMARFLRPDTPPLRLGSATLHVEQVIGTPQGHPLAGYGDFSTLLNEAGTDREIQLHFSSPTAFSLGQGPSGKKRMGVLPEQIPDFKALAGDASDNIPGAKGIGPKAAAALLLKYGTLEAVLDARTDTIPPATAEQLRTFKRIVSMVPDELEVTLPRTAQPDWAAAAAKLREFGADNVAERVAARV